MQNSILPRIHKEGYKFLAISIIITFILLMISKFLGSIFILITIWVYYFFRDPERFSINDDKFLVSPADGLITNISDVSGPIELNLEIILILVVLGVTIFLFVTELFRIDFTAIVVMLVLGILNQFPNINFFPDPSDIFSGFSSNAVLSIIAVMIIGAGLDKTGLMSKVAATILKHGGKSEARIVPIVSSTVGLISSFIEFSRI